MPQNPIGSVLTTLLVLVSLTISRLIPALRISLSEGLPAYQSLASSLASRVQAFLLCIGAFAVRPEINPLRLVWL